MRNYLLFALAATILGAATIAGGIFEGKYSYRWGQPPQMDEAARLLAALPTEIGGWTRVKDYDLQPAAQEILECAGYFHRSYVHSTSKQHITVALIVGPPGPMAIHTPEICYSNRDFVPRGGRQSIEVRPGLQPKETFWHVALRSNDLEASSIRCLYAWNGGNGWVASESPRFAFGGSPMLFKLQVIAPLSSQQNRQSGLESIVEFLHAFLPPIDDLITASLKAA